VWRAEGGVLSEIALEKAHRVLSNPDYKIKDVSATDLSVAAEQLRTIYNKAWSLFTGVKPMTSEEAQKLMRTLKPIIDPNLIYFAYHNDEPIGFFVMVPDLNRIIGKFNGKFGLWQKLRLMWELKVSKSCDRVFGIIFGITPEFQGKGIESAIMTYILENYIQTGRSPYNSFEFAWIGDFNPVMNRMIERYVCATKHKMHTTYRYLFDRTRPFERCPRLGLKRA
jgi:GNAT superfamily N-acetyltransferase